MGLLGHLSAVVLELALHAALVLLELHLHPLLQLLLRALPLHLGLLMDRLAMPVQAFAQQIKVCLNVRDLVVHHGVILELDLVEDPELVLPLGFAFLRAHVGLPHPVPAPLRRDLVHLDQILLQLFPRHADQIHKLHLVLLQLRLALLGEGLELLELLLGHLLVLHLRSLLLLLGLEPRRLQLQVELSLKVVPFLHQQLVVLGNLLGDPLDEPVQQVHTPLQIQLLN